jgi:cobalt-zinc-cadmium efflux system membrane fusion protein
VIRSPITGVITARNAAPGLLEQPGIAPAPYSVADTNTLWLIADVTEEDSPAFAVGQELQVTVDRLCRTASSRARSTRWPRTSIRPRTA